MLRDVHCEQSRSRSILDTTFENVLYASSPITIHYNNMCAHNATHNSSTITRNCHALDSPHVVGAQSRRREFLVKYSSSTRRIRFSVMPVMYCINVESSSRIEFPRVDSCRSNDHFTSHQDVFRHAHTAFDAHVQFDTFT